MHAHTPVHLNREQGGLDEQILTKDLGPAFKKELVQVRMFFKFVHVCVGEWFQHEYIATIPVKNAKVSLFGLTPSLPLIFGLTVFLALV